MCPTMLQCTSCLASCRFGHCNHDTLEKNIFEGIALVPCAHLTRPHLERSVRFVVYLEGALCKGPAAVQDRFSVMFFSFLD